MSYDISLCDPLTNEPLKLDSPHHMKGGTYEEGGCDTAEINITYNYGEHFRRVLGGDGIRSIYGMTGAESITVLRDAAAQLGNDIDADYWRPTEGNAKLALLLLLALARLRPDGVWRGD